MTLARLSHACIVALAILTAPCLAQRTINVNTDDTLRAALRNAQPGDTIQIAPGIYQGGLYAEGLRGIERRPNGSASLCIMGSDPDEPPVIRGGKTGLHLVKPHIVSVSNLVIEDCEENGLNIDDGGDMDMSAEDVHLDRIVVRNIGSDGNHDGIKLSGLKNAIIASCTIERWGKGGSAIDMVGCVSVVIHGTTLRHDPDAAATGIQIKGGSQAVRVLNCIFVNAGRRAINAGGSTGEHYFRPPLKDRDNAEARHVKIERCIFIGSESPIALPTSENCKIIHSTFYRPTKWIVRLLQEQPLDRFVSSGGHTFEDNTVIWRTGDIHTFVNIGPNTRPESLTFSGNTWYCEDAPDQSTPTLPVKETNGVYGKRPPDDVLRQLHRLSADTPRASSP